MINISNLSYSYNGHRVLIDVSLSIKEGSIVGLIGPSGGGKSTLLKIMSGVLQSDCSALSFGGLKAEDISLMFQEGALFDSLTVFDNIAFPLVHGSVPVVTLPEGEKRVVHSKVEEILSKVGLAHAAFKYPSQLSGGMRRRVSLARALVAKPRLVLLDDPTAGLDPVASSVIMNLIVQIHQEYRPTMLVVSHDLRRLLPVSESIVALFDGRVVFSGTLEELKEHRDDALSSFVCCRFDLGR